MLTQSWIENAPETSISGEVLKSLELVGMQENRYGPAGHPLPSPPLTTCTGHRCRLKQGALRLMGGTLLTPQEELSLQVGLMPARRR